MDAHGLTLKVIDPSAQPAGSTDLPENDAKILARFLAMHGVETGGGDDHD